ncbi:hypothetical protein [Burkholderia cepacia]|uniref:hypothetical protein n=1 Tax=Burkholderia cepacia TaxID=292 RepID=UPI002AB65CBB|nr:hypothetical protein [Burkholderia cepacia]
MADEKKPSLLRDLALAILPLFCSVFLFASMLETYKNDVSARKDQVIDFYRPMRSAEADCSATHNQLFLKYFAQAGSYKLMLNEFDHFSSGDPSTMSRDYGVLLQSIIEAGNKANNEIVDLKSKVEVCKSALYRKYEEIAIATGTYDRFLDIENHHIKYVNALYAKRTDMATDATKKFNVESIMDTLRQSVSADFDSPETRRVLALKIGQLGNPAIDFFTKMGQNEQEIFKIDQEADVQLTSLFANEVSRRYKRGFLSAMLQW